jgi:hypothetical protein
MPIKAIRILPPIAIARLGNSSTPLAAYSLGLPENDPLDFRRIIPQETLHVDPATGSIINVDTPKSIQFKDEEGLRPVAPFLEVWVEDECGSLVPLTLELLKNEGLSPQSVSWSVEVANLKAYRRTKVPGDRITAKLENFSDHNSHPLLGQCDHFMQDRTLPLGSVRYICPTTEFPEIRLRFTPAAGHVYGASMKRHTSTLDEEDDPIFKDHADRVIYDPQYPWFGYSEPDNPTLTNPGAIYAGYEDGKKGQVSWGYLDDACDGFITVMLALGDDAKPLTARAHISSGPPTFVPDALPIRTAADDLLQIILGPDINEDEVVPVEVALEIVRRSLDTIRQLNTAVMNGNPVNGRLRVASTMVNQDSNDFGRQYAPIMATSLVDQSAVRALHDRVFTALSSGSAPWFAHVLRQPDEIGDLTDNGRRKMPAMMRGADGRMLCLTRRQINEILRAASSAIFTGTFPPSPT